MLSDGSTIGPFTVGRLLRTDAFCSLYEGFSDQTGQHVVLKEADPMSSANETVALGLMLEAPDPRFVPYLPTPLWADGAVQAFRYLENFYSLADVLDQYPDGIDPRDMAWMYRRLLVALGFTHQAGFCHGAVLPQNVLIEPDVHGVVLSGWAHAVTIPKDGECTCWDCINDLACTAQAPELAGAYPGFEGWYPPDNLASPALDVYMAAVCVVSLIGGDPTAPASRVAGLPSEYYAFLGGSLNPAPEHRLSDAWQVLEYFDALLQRLYGKRRFRPFSMQPKGN